MDSPAFVVSLSSLMRVKVRFVALNQIIMDLMFNGLRPYRIRRVPLMDNFRLIRVKIMGVVVSRRVNSRMMLILRSLYRQLSWRESIIFGIFVCRVMIKRFKILPQLSSSNYIQQWIHQLKNNCLNLKIYLFKDVSIKLSKHIRKHNSR